MSLSRSPCTWHRRRTCDRPTRRSRFCPSPKFQAYDLIVPPGADEVPALNEQVNAVQLAVNAAVGAAACSANRPRARQSESLDTTVSVDASGAPEVQADGMKVSGRLVCVVERVSGQEHTGDIAEVDVAAGDELIAHGAVVGLEVSVAQTGLSGERVVEPTVGEDHAGHALHLGSVHRRKSAAIGLARAGLDIRPHRVVIRIDQRRCADRRSAERGAVETCRRRRRRTACCRP